MPRTLADALGDAIRSDHGRALRAVRISERLARLHQQAVIDVAEARLVDVNQLVEAVIAAAGPLCRSAGVPVVAEQDRRLPRVRVLVEPIRDALDAAIDLFLAASGPALLRARTSVRGSNAVATLARWSRTPPRDPLWREVGGLADRPEFVVGRTAARAIGGRLRLEARGEDLRLRLELPFAERPRSGFAITFWHGKRPRALADRLDLPGH